MDGRFKRPCKQRHPLAVACGLVWHGVGHLPCPLQSVSDMPVHHHMEFALNADDTAISHVPQASAACQIPRVVSRRPRAVAKRMNSHQRLEEQCDALR